MALAAGLNLARTSMGWSQESVLVYLVVVLIFLSGPILIANRDR
jgi:hypothetical protein